VSIQVIYLIFLDLQIFYLYLANSAANQANYSAAAGRYFFHGNGLTGPPGKTRPPASYRLVGAFDFYSIAKSAR
jgi:hypothetical protein